MRRKYQSTSSPADASLNTAALTKANFELLTKLIPKLAASERLQEKFRFAVIHQLTRLEAAVSLLLVGQEAAKLSNPPFVQAEKLREAARETEEFIAQQSQKTGLKVIHFLYDEDAAPERRRDRRRRWWGWEI
jgi:hypothetical protein